MVADLGWIPVPWKIIGMSCLFLFALVALRGSRNFLFLKSALLVVAAVGNQTGKFRKYAEHELSSDLDGQQHRRR